MLEFSKIDKDFKIYKENKVFLFGASSGGEKVKKDFDLLGIPIEAFVDNDDKKQGTNFCGVDVITFGELRKRIEEDCKYIIQISSSYENEIAKQLSEIDVNFIFYSEFENRSIGYRRYRLVKDNPELIKMAMLNKWMEKYTRHTEEVMSYLENRNEKKRQNPINIVLAPPKVGNVTLNRSCDREDLLKLWHTYICIEPIKSYFL